MFLQIFSIEVGHNGRDKYGEQVDNVMAAAGYTKVLNLCCDKWGLDNIYVRNDFKSSFFKGDGKPRLITDKFNKYGKEMSAWEYGLANNFPIWKIGHEMFKEHMLN